MKHFRRFTAFLLASIMTIGLCSCSAGSGSSSDSTNAADGSVNESGQSTTAGSSTRNKTEAMTAIEDKLNLANMNPEWTYDDSSDSWTLSIVTAVTKPQIEDEQGVSVCVPAAYVKGVDTDGDGEADVTSGTANGNLVMDDEASVTSSNGQVYTAATAPVIVNTGAAGYSEQQNQTAASTYAKEGYINVACGNRGKQSTTTDESGNTVYTGDAPSCLVDQKNAVRFVKYNILLGNLPGSVDYFVSTGGSGGGAHAVMLAASSDHSDYYDYEIAAGAVGVYQDENGNYITSVTIDGQEMALSDGVWGCMAYSAITSLSEADMAMAFEYYLDTDYEFNTAFQKQTAQYLAAEYMDYINEKNLSVSEADLGFDLNQDGDTEDTVPLTIEYDAQSHEDTNGYYGTYLDLYLSEFRQSLNDYLDRLDYAQDWTWFDTDGNALSDEEVAAMSSDDKAQAFIEGRYAKGSSESDRQGPGPGGFPGGNNNGGGPGGFPGGNGNGGQKGFPGGNQTGEDQKDFPGDVSDDNQNNFPGGGEKVGTPDSGTTQSAGSGTDSGNYSSLEEMLEAYQSDIAELEAGDEYGNNIVDLYNPINYIGAEGTSNPAWARILSGASEGDISMMNSLNLQIAWLNAGTDAEIEWQWDGGHVPSEILGDSLSLYVDEMYGKYKADAVAVTKEDPSPQTANGSATEAAGTDISGWVTYDSKEGAAFTLADAVSYRTAGASKAIPGFDVIDYGQEDYVFGSSTKDARHWDKYVLKVLEENQETLSGLFNTQ
ncbi:MAG: hypothetical protein IJ137_04640 [Eubacterium sp.]|nr:hypothetical protein [Eubacterium sp.]